jgi:hypothetical protein
MEDGKLHNLNIEHFLNLRNFHYETVSKELNIYYLHLTNGNYRIQLDNFWKVNPKYHSFDIIATRWISSKTPDSYVVTGTQYPSSSCGLANVDYSESSSSNNIVKESYGAGLSQNLYDNCKPLSNYLFVTSPTHFGNAIYGTYQHATSNVSLATSKAYTFSATGLGGVLDHSYATYYDGMTGANT